MSEHSEVPPIRGYHPLREEQVARINVFKELEAQCLGELSVEFQHPCQHRQLQRGADMLQDAFMIITRAIAQRPGIPNKE